MTCVQCGSKDIIRNASIVDFRDNNIKGDVLIEVSKKPRAFIFKGTVQSPLFANVCVTCGYVMLSVTKEDAQNLAAALV